VLLALALATLVSVLVLFPSRTASALTPPKADYRFQNKLSTSVGNAPNLTDIGPRNNTFTTATVDGAPRKVLHFPRGNGVKLSPTTSVVPNDTYTIVVLFELDSVDGFRRIIDFKNATSDSGLYIQNGRLRFFPTSSAGPSPIAANQYVQVALSRDSGGTVVGYVEGVQQFSFSDTSGEAVIDANDALRFFRDNQSGGASTEHSAGSVARIRLYDSALSASDVGALDRAPDTYRNATPILLPEEGQATPYPSEIKVSTPNTSAPITDVNLRLHNFFHTYPDDVAVLLVGPQNQKALLMADVGGSLKTLPAVTNVNLVLDDEATRSLPDEADEGAITSGTYRPTRGTTPSGGGKPAPDNFPLPAPAGPYGSTLSLFDNTNPNGTWKLFVVDDSPIFSGVFAGGWSLEIHTDTTPPKVKSTAPKANATGVSPNANVRATFSERMKGASVSDTNFMLFKKGSSIKVGASVTYNDTAREGILNPDNSLRKGITYKAVVTTFAQDLFGNHLDQSTAAGLQEKVWFFKVRN
jgi:hypothetical protein